ncbi:hypothetical protein GMST_06670 [Geomonas silvestris]|uniref:Uncharacterized protein n=1 Tax=Geomonas silvestris TaxID=2740184 RepID=A0A6V8MEI7_9BACT|nr:hypothetical protein GMST_06670 [Geomonas silvestris]
MIDRVGATNGLRRGPIPSEGQPEGTGARYWGEMLTGKGRWFSNSVATGVERGGRSLPKSKAGANGTEVLQLC